MKKQDVAGLIVYLIILALAAVFGLVVIRNYASSGTSGMDTGIFILFVIGAILAGIVFNAILFELAHIIGAKIGGYKVTSVSILGLTWSKIESKTKFHFTSFDGLTGETKIIPIEGRKKKSNPIPYLIFGTLLFAIEVIAVVFAFSILTRKNTSALSNNLAYFLLVMMVVGGMILIYNIIPLQLDSTTDGYRLRQVSGKKNRDAFNAMLLGKTDRVDTEQEEVKEETSFSSNLKLNKVYTLLSENNFIEAEKAVDEAIESALNDKKASTKTLMDAKAQKVFLTFFNGGEQAALEYCEKNLDLHDRKYFSEENELLFLRAYVLVAGILDKSRSECTRTLSKVFKAYKRTPDTKRSIESKLFNLAIDKVNEKHPDWELLEYKINEQ